jgi:hypothetical protein
MLRFEIVDGVSFHLTANDVRRPRLIKKHFDEDQKFILHLFIPDFLGAVNSWIN